MSEIKRLKFDSSEAVDYIKKVERLNVGLNLQYFIETYGCQMNVHDSEYLAGMLEKMGYSPSQNKEEADIILFNTCCVRENAELRVYGNVGALKALKQQRPQLKIGICGCMMQQPQIVESIKKRFKFVDVIFGSHNPQDLPKLLFNSLTQNSLSTEILNEATDIVEDEPIKRDNKFTAWVTVMYGCNNFCSYCIVPYVRGRERSRRSTDIIREVERLAANGCVEITLLGQNVNSYGKDCGEISFAQLLERIDKIPGIKRINFMTSHPKDCSDELIEAIAKCPHVSRQLHLPVQSGSDRILKLMNRKYTAEDYLKLIRRVKERIPDIAITTDIIVGFPGETEEDFMQTMSLFETAGYASAYTFIYSKRDGTPAAQMKQQVSTEIKKARLKRLIALQSSCTAEFHKRYIDGVYPVLAESVSKRSEKMLSGRTHCGRMVSFEGDKKLIGNIVNVKITQAKANTLLGVIVREN